MSHLFVLMQQLLPQHLLSRLAGKFAAGTFAKNLLIRAFIKRYRVDLSEAVIQDPGKFENFNAFFTRELQAGARPIAQEPDAIVCPGDGAISQLGAIDDDRLLQAKGRQFSLLDLLGGDSQMADLFKSGSFATVYLSPRDYHRVHMPLTGQLQKMIYVPGKLFSVNQVAADKLPNLFARNERCVCLFQTEVGPMAVILVGAMIVAGIETVWAGQVCPTAGSRTVRSTDFSEHRPPIQLSTGAELGRFKLGSTAIVLFAHGAIELEDSLVANSTVRMGQLLGRIRPGQTRSL